MTITGCEVIPLRIPRRRAPQLGGRPTDDWSAHVLVRLATDSGDVGLGEARLHRQWSYETLETATTTIRTYLAPELVGLPADDLAAVHAAMDQAIAPNIARGQPIAKSAVDMAVCDLLARSSGLSLAAWLGAEEPVAVRTNALLSPTSADEAEAQAGAALEAGFESFKLNLGQGREVDLEMVRAVKQVVGDRYLLAEANQGYDLDTALQVGHGLDRLGVSAFEQPLPANQIVGLKTLKERLHLPIQLDESIYGPEDLLEFIKLDAVECVTLKVSKGGGVSRAAEAARIAWQEGIAIAGSGLAESGVGLAASAALFASLGLRENLTLNGPQLLEADLIQTPIFSAGGQVSLPAGQLGLGVALADEVIERYRVAI